VSPNREDHDGFGSIDPDALFRIREVFWRHEPLVETAEIDSPARPSVLSVTLAVGFDSPGRFDIRWSHREYYSFHYQESENGPAFRFDRHPNPHSPETHFHPPPDASTDGAEPSCIEVAIPDLVTLAVLEAWRHALDREDVSLVNALDDPP
jgi:hypothetical protein